MFFTVEVDPAEVEASTPTPSQQMHFIAPGEDGTAEEHVVAADGSVQDEQEVGGSRDQRRAAAKSTKKKSTKKRRR